ncbi:sensor histidine kinase [Phenylobacterium sp.]|jgi:two-component sensor histidine kinase|uniref:sensor histidine kinase n=1 Tax=Phenylobacterium sp. TaxID=1871053 RepID=UPI002F94A1E6
MEGSKGRPSGARVSALQGLLAQLAAAALLGLATLVRLELGETFQNLVAFSLYYPVIMAAALAGGWPVALLTLLGGGLLGWYFFLPPAGALAVPSPATLVNLALYSLSGLCIALGGVHLRDLVGRLRLNSARLAERELRYRTLFDTVSEGFALVRGVRNAEGALVDYVILEANPAMLRILNTDATIIGRRQSEVIPSAPANWMEACRRALDGEPLTFEYNSPGSSRWFEIQLARVADDQLAQLVQEITHRKVAEARQSEMFDELNHRVKNNLALVSSLLALQARTAPPDVRGHLQKAVDRIQAISDVHASLYRSSRKDDVDFAAYLGDLCQRLQSSLLEHDRIRISLLAEPAVLPLDRAVAVGVVVNELVTNAAKHAYPPPAAGEISVRLERVDRSLVLSVADRGRGLPGEPGAGLGMRLVRSMVQQIGGSLEVSGEGGAVFTVRVPDVPQHAFTVHEPQGRLL